MEQKKMRDVLMAALDDMMYHCACEWSNSDPDKMVELDRAHIERIANRYASQLEVLETERMTFDQANRDPGNVAVVYDDGRHVPVRLTLGGEGVECAGYASQLQPEPVNQKLLDAAKKVSEKLERKLFVNTDLRSDLRHAVAVAEVHAASTQPVNQQMLAALKIMVKQFTKTPSTLKDTEARCAAHKAIAAAEAAQPVDKGPWRHGITKDMKPRVFVESDDFTHDVRLYVDGDFADTAERVAYAKGIEQQLNAAKPVAKQAEPVAWIEPCDLEDVATSGQAAAVIYGTKPDFEHVPLYTHPPAVAVPDNLLARLEHHMQDKENTAFARSTMRELRGLLSAAQKQEGV